MIRINGLEKKYSSDFTLKIDELHIDKGERVALIGPNGSGKSTLLKLIAGIIRPDKGEILISPEATLGYSPQSPFAFRGTVRSNILLGAKGNRIEDLLEKCLLKDIADKNIRNISGGEKQRMCFARILAGGYDCLLLDEPLSAADIETAQILRQVLIQECINNGTTLLTATHTPKEAMETATKILLLNNGEIAEYTEISEGVALKSEFGKKFTELWTLN